MRVHITSGHDRDEARPPAGALLAADVAAKSILGRWWWIPIVALGLATLVCLRSVLNKDTDLGPLASTFYETYGAYEGQRSVKARKQSVMSSNAQRPAPLPPAPVQMPAPSSVPHVGPSGPRS
jgi:hypothetical protein